MPALSLPPQLAQIAPTAPSIERPDPERVYHRSRLPLASSGLNPIAVAASTLLTLLSHAPLVACDTEPEGLLVALVHEVWAFEAQLSGQYQKATIRLASWLLTAVLDETLLRCLPNRCSLKRADLPTVSLLATLHWRTSERPLAVSRQLAQLIQQLRSEPERARELLELAYLCLSLGEASRPDLPVREQWDALRDTLYQALPPQHTPTPPPAYQSAWGKRTVLNLLALGSAALLLAYGLMASSLEGYLAAILQSLSA